MAAPSISYRKLPGRGATGMEYQRLYLAADHLLLVSSTGFSESYRRFYFRDIQSVIVRKNATGAIQNVLLGVFLALCLFGMASGGPTFTMAWVLGWGLSMLFFLALLVLNIVRGPTCVCHIRTAVQNRRLGCIGRLRTARRLLNTLRPLAESAQGAMPLETLRQRIDQARAEVSASPPVIRGQSW